MQAAQESNTLISRDTDCQDWHREPSSPQLVADEEESTRVRERGWSPIDADMTSANNGTQPNEDSGVPPASASVYATSVYPKVQTAYQVEQPYENGVDDATIDSSRTLYAEDIDYVETCGRQYVGDYYMPVDQTEQTRAYVMHQVYLKLFNLELTTVPLDNPKAILDIGTGIGEWAIGMAEKYPECEVFGTDIAAIQPTQQVPFNVEFNIENAEDEWIRSPNTFDLVHFRNLAGAFADWRFIYEQTFDCLHPDGWIEVLDFDNIYDDSSTFTSFYPPDSHGQRLFKLFKEASLLAGRGGPGLVDHMDESLLIEAGFVDVKTSTYNIGIGTRENAAYGKFWLFAMVTGFEANAIRLMTRYLGWEENRVRELCHLVAEETKAIAEDMDRPAGFSVPLRVLVARKPIVPGQWTAKALNENAAMDMEVADYTGSGTGSGDESTIGSISRATIRSGSTA